MKVCIAGATGWIGRPLAAAIAKSGDMTLAAAVARSAAGEDIEGVRIVGSVEEALKIPFDVFVDYTSAEVVRRNVLAAIEAGRHVVIGSSGLSDDDFREIDARARTKKIGVIAVGNFAISAALVQRFAAEAAKHFPAWEIIDYADDRKVDAPSGTARELAWRLSQTGRKSKPRVPLEQTVGERGTRGATVGVSQVHSVRLPGHIIGLEVIFGRPDERLSIRYEGGVGAEPYIEGTLLAIRRAPAVTGVVRGLDSLL